MEMPIAVMITLFVAVVVAGILISFSQGIILQSKDKLRDLNQDEKSELDDKVIKLGNVDASTVKDLAIQCAKDVSQSIKEVLCFVIRGDSFDVAGINGIDQDTILHAEKNLTINVNIVAGFNALFITYNPLGSIDIKN